MVCTSLNMNTETVDRGPKKDCAQVNYAYNFQQGYLASLIGLSKPRGPGKPKRRRKLA